MMEARKLCYSYGRAPCLKDIDLSLEPGKLYAIIGPNGSGKTTLIRLLARLTKPRAGELLLDGKPYEGYTRREFARQVALLPQGRNTPGIPAWDLVACGRYPYLDMSRRLTEQDREMVRRAMEITDTQSLAQRSLKQLSGGERQRVYMAMLYAQDTPYVLLDEPTTHLDMGTGFQLMEQLAQMKQRGKAVVAVLHDLPLALQYADEILLMQEGRVLLRAAPEEMVNSGLLQSVFRVSCTPVETGGGREYVFNMAHGFNAGSGPHIF